MKGKTYYYTDPCKDDFAGNEIKQQCLPDNFKYVNHCALWNIAAFVFYRLIAKPIALLYCLLGYGLRVKNAKVLRKVKGGYFVYANHTQGGYDAFAPNVINFFGRKTYIVVNPDATSIKGLRQIVLMAGGIPVPTSNKHYRAYLAAVTKRITQKRNVLIYPERHIWPFYTGIRPYDASSFAYPVSCNAPIFTMTTTYTKGLLGRAKATVYVDGPFYPDASLPPKEAKQQLRDIAYETMCTRSQASNYSVNQYINAQDYAATPNKTQSSH